MPCASERPPRGPRRTTWPARGRRARDPGPRWPGRGPRARRRHERGEAGEGPGASAAAARRRGGAPRAVRERLRGRAVGGGPAHVAFATTASLDGDVVDRRGLGGPVGAKRSSSERSRITQAGHRGAHAAATARSASLEAAQTTPTSTSRKRAGAGRARRARSAPARPCRSRAAGQVATGGRADRVAAAPELGRHTGVARVAQQPAPGAAAQLPGGLALELEVQPAVVDRPRPVGLDRGSRRRCLR